MRTLIQYHAAILLVCILLSACDSREQTPTPPAVPEKTGTQSGTPSTTETPPPPPSPPVVETFDKEPQLNLFARVGSYRPDDDNAEGLGYWSAFIDHVQRTSGMRPKAGRSDSRGWVVHGIKGLDSIAFFAPLAVKPTTSYTVSFDLKGDFPKGTKAGIGVLEFSEFLWISDQFTEAMSKEFQTASFPGVTVTNKSDWKTYTFTFTTTPRAGMIHLVIFREGPMDREIPILFDNISVEERKGVARVQ